MNHSSNGCRWVEPDDEPLDKRKKHTPSPQLAKVVSDSSEHRIDAIAFLTGEVVAIQLVVQSSCGLCSARSTNGDVTVSGMIVWRYAECTAPYARGHFPHNCDRGNLDHKRRSQIRYPLIARFGITHPTTYGRHTDCHAVFVLPRSNCFYWL